MIIKLNDGKEVRVSRIDFERVSRYSWRSRKCKKGVTHYAFRNVGPAWKRTTVLMHRFILRCSVGDGMIVDHKDHNGLNNLRSNIRKCTKTNNAQNRVKADIPSTSKFKGVYWSTLNKCWLARIKLNKKGIHLGRFSNQEDAARAYDRASRKYFGTFAYINFRKGPS